ncbi:MAG: Crp/Fnr family transcriptional regulator [Crocinitomicaceae bacterium]|nr:MAG: Crp/Fnr family transcriptional regulator [Crocinitomicaceae bacterium]
MDTLENIVEFKASPQIRAKLLEYGTVKQFVSGETILRENSYIKSIPIVISGSVGVIRTEEDGREIMLYYIKAGESCIMSFLGGMHDEMSKVKAVAEDNASILFIPVDKINTLIREFPEWLDYIFRLYHKRFEELLEVINAVAFKKMDERILDSIKKKSQVQQSNVITITHEQLANELGTARVVVSRLLKQLEEMKVIELGRNKITLL